jgi:uncharacterized membrane protein
MSGKIAIIFAGLAGKTLATVISEALSIAGLENPCLVSIEQVAILHYAVQSFVNDNKEYDAVIVTAFIEKDSLKFDSSSIYCFLCQLAFSSGVSIIPAFFNQDSLLKEDLSKLAESLVCSVIEITKLKIAKHLENYINKTEVFIYRIFYITLYT